MKTMTQNTVCLDPFETEIVIEAFLHDVKHLEEPDSDDVYSFTFSPASYHDVNLLYETIEDGLTKVLLRTPAHEQKDIKSLCEDEKGLSQVFTMFKPKVDGLKVDNPQFKQASLRLHLNDDPSGRVYLNCSYVDIYQDIEPEDVDEKPAQPGDDWW